MKEIEMPRILVVDDEKVIVELLREFLSAKGYEVYTATDGLVALQRVKEVKPHVVLLDIIMPGLGGIDVLKEIKRIDPDIGVVMATAVVDEELAKRTLQLGAYDYIIKPFNLKYLDTVLMVILINVCDNRK